MLGDKEMIMKRSLILASAGLALIGVLLMTNGCSTRSPGHTIPNTAFRLAQKAPYAKQANPAAAARVIDLFSDYSAEPVAAKIRGVYADKFFFRDGFKELHELEALADYMVKGTEPLRSCSFEFSEPVFDGGDCYLRWVMKVNLNRDPEDAMQECIGMSHIRFDESGKVVYQQDYWDPTDILYSRIPLVGWAIKKVHQRL